MKKFLFLSALVVMGFACIGCTTNDTTNGTQNGTTVETPATNNGMDNSTSGTMNGNGTTNGNGTATDNALNNTATDGVLNNNSNVDDAANGVVTDQNGMINDGDKNVK